MIPKQYTIACLVAVLAAGCDFGSTPIPPEAPEEEADEEGIKEEKTFHDPRSIWIEYQSDLMARDWEGIWRLFSEEMETEFMAYFKHMKMQWEKEDPDEKDPDLAIRYGELAGKEAKGIFALLMTKIVEEESRFTSGNWEFVEEVIRGDGAFITFQDEEGYLSHMMFKKGQDGWRLAGLPKPGGGKKPKKADEEAPPQGERFALGSLKCICVGEEQFKACVAIDRNADGVGEYGFLGELGGVVVCRGGESKKYEASPFIPRILGECDATGVARKRGWCVILYLPTGPSTATATPDMDVDPELAQHHWIAYAWPLEARDKDNGLYVLDPRGQPYRLELSPFVGPANPPPWYEALASKGAKGWADEIDEQNWKPCG